MYVGHSNLCGDRKTVVDVDVGHLNVDRRRCIPWVAGWNIGDTPDASTLPYDMLCLWGEMRRVYAMFGTEGKVEYPPVLVGLGRGCGVEPKVDDVPTLTLSSSFCGLWCFCVR